MHSETMFAKKTSKKNGKGARIIGVKDKSHNDYYEMLENDPGLDGAEFWIFEILENGKILFNDKEMTVEGFHECLRAGGEIWSSRQLQSTNNP